MLRFPRPLRPGDGIAVTAPSAGVPAALHPRLQRALAVLRERGYRVIEGECLRASHRHVSAPARARAAELMQFLTDPTIAAVIPPWGGELALELLPLLDYARLAAQPPVWLSGFSDISTLQLALATRAGWASLHGPALMELAADPLDPLSARLFEVLTTAPGETIEQHASTHHQREDADWIREPAAGLRRIHPTRWARLDGRDAPLRLRGRLLGGCLDTWSRLAGTPYGDVPGLRQRAGADGLLLHLENAEMRPCELARALLALRLHGWFDGLQGVLIGRHAATDAAAADALDLRGAVELALGDLDCPVLIDLDIGHQPPQLSLVNGALAEVHCADGGGWVRQRWG